METKRLSTFTPQAEIMTAKAIQFDIITVFPQFFDSPFGFGILGRAIAEDRVRIRVHNLRDFTSDRHKTVDDRPFGGGEGMVLKPEPLFRAVESLGIAEKNGRDLTRERVVLLSAQGKSFTQAIARDLAHIERIVFLCGRYEGVDERVNDRLADTELSIGDYVISGGELAAAVMIDAVTRLLPGVLGNEDSARYESFSGEPAPLRSSEVPDGDVSRESPPPRSTCDSGGLLDYPHYTRPPEFRGAAVPPVLSSGNHEDIRRWRRRQSLSKTLQNRPDLLVDAPLTEEDRALLDEMRHDR
jgi:tRNA (guanine37-N1)-methyltransferase